MDAPRYRSARTDRAAVVADGCEIWTPRWQEGGFAAMPAFVERELAR